MKIEYTCGSNAISRNINNLNLELLCSKEDEIISELDRLKKSKELVHNIPLESTIELLDKCAKLWLDKEYSKEHIRIISQITNQSEELVSYELENTMTMLLRENTEKIVKEELGNIEVLDDWVETTYGYVHRQPRGVTFHNISGNAFVVIPMSISMGLLSKNCNLVKVSGDEPYFAYAFYKSLCDIDITVKERLSVIYFNSEEGDVYDSIVKRSNCVIHWVAITQER